MDVDSELDPREYYPQDVVVISPFYSIMIYGDKMVVMSICPHDVVEKYPMMYPINVSFIMILSPFYPQELT